MKKKWLCAVYSLVSIIKNGIEFMDLAAVFYFFQSLTRFRCVLLLYTVYDSRVILAVSFKMEDRVRCV